MHAHFLKKPEDYAFLNVFGSRMDGMYAPWIDGSSET
jgi:hypothetical protein